MLENDAKKAGARSSYFPELKNQSGFLHSTSVENIQIPAGAFGVIPNAGLVPTHPILIDQGNQTYVLSGTTLAQPLTPLIRIRQASRIASSEIAASQDELKSAENEVALKVHQLYYGILVAGLELQAAEQDCAYAVTRLRESEEDIRNGSALKISALEGRTGVLESEQSILAATLHLSDLATELNELMGTPLSATLELKPPETARLDSPAREEYIKTAIAGNPKVLAAMEAVEQAKAGVTAAKSAFIPDVSAFAKHSYQNGVPFLVHNFGTFGLTLTYDVFDFGKRRATIREREAKLAEAQENVERLKEAVSVEIDGAYNKMERTKHMLKVVAEVVELRAEAERVAENQMAQGVVLASVRRQASAASYKARSQQLQVQLAYRLAFAELEQAAGRTPGL